MVDKNKSIVILMDCWEYTKKDPMRIANLRSEMCVNINKFIADQKDSIQTVVNACYNPGVLNTEIDTKIGPEFLNATTPEQFAKIYKRKLNSGMAASLVWLVRTYLEKQNWIYVWKIAPKFILRSAEIGKLAHWELAIQKTNEDDDSKRTSGLWKPTEKGIKFVRRRIFQT